MRAETKLPGSMLSKNGLSESNEKQEEKQ